MPVPFRRRTVTSLGRRFAIDRGVFDPARHLSGVAFAPQLLELVPTGSRALDLGTGCGILAAAARERAAEVVATDIDEGAVACARRNLADLDVDVRLGDLFQPVAGERFDLVICNPPYVIGPSDDLTYASPDLLERLGREAPEHADRVVLGYPADEASALAITGLPLELWRAVPTRGRPLGIFLAVLR